MTDLVSLLFIAMVSIDCKIKNFSLHLYIVLPYYMMICLHIMSLFSVTRDLFITLTIRSLNTNKVNGFLAIKPISTLVPFYIIEISLQGVLIRKKLCDSTKIGFFKSYCLDHHDITCLYTTLHQLILFF